MPYTPGMTKTGDIYWDSEKKKWIKRKHKQEKMGVRRRFHKKVSELA